MAPFWDDQPGTWWQVDYTVSVPSQNGQCFASPGRDTVDMNLPFRLAMLLPKLPSVFLQNASPTVIVSAL